MKCRVCGKEIEENSEFCRYCGASQKKKRKPTWSERRKQRERETEEIINKSRLTEKDVLLAVPVGADAIKITALGDTHSQYVKCALLAALYAVVAAAALAGLVLMIRFDVDGLSRTIRAVIAFALLLVLAGFGASFADRFYSARVFSKMGKSDRAVKKVSYGKAPYVSENGKLYRIVYDAPCVACGAEVHIEEFDGRLYTVCNYDRTHLGVLSTDEIFAKITGEKVVGVSDAEKNVAEQNCEGKNGEEKIVEEKIGAEGDDTDGASAVAEDAQSGDLAQGGKD